MRYVPDEPQKRMILLKSGIMTFSTDFDIFMSKGIRLGR